MGAFLTSHFFLQNRHFILNCREGSLRIASGFHNLQAPLEQMAKTFPLKQKRKVIWSFTGRLKKAISPTHTLLTW